MFVTQEAADYLQINARSVARLCKIGIIKATKRGRDYWIEDEEVERYDIERHVAGHPNGLTGGVYRIVNTHNGRVYIGACRDMPERWDQHCRLLTLGTHYNVDLQSDWNVAGREAFLFETIEYAPSTDLQEIERKWITHYGDSAYNRDALTKALKRNGGLRSKERKQRQWTCYAIVYAYGRDVVNNGNRADSVHRFPSAAQRTRFLHDQETGGFQADAIKQSHPSVRKALRYAAQGADWPQLV